MRNEHPYVGRHAVWVWVADLCTRVSAFYSLLCARAALTHLCLPAANLQVLDGSGALGGGEVSGRNDLAGELLPVRFLGWMGSDDNAANMCEDGCKTKLLNCQTSKRELGIGRRNKLR